MHYKIKQMIDTLIKNYRSKFESAFLKQYPYELAEMGTSLPQYYINGIASYPISYDNVNGNVRFKASYDESETTINMIEITPKYVANICEYFGIEFNLERMVNNLAVAVGESREKISFTEGEQPTFTMHGTDYTILSANFLTDIVVVNDSNNNTLTFSNRSTPGSLSFSDLYWVLINNIK